MIKLFIVEGFYVIFIIDDSLTFKIYCTDLKLFWSITKYDFSKTNLIYEIFEQQKPNVDDIQIKVELINGNISLKVLKHKIDSINIKLGEYDLTIDNDHSVLQTMIEAIFQEINCLSEKKNTTDVMFTELKSENEKLGKEFKSLSDLVLSREDKLMNKMCFLLNEKKRKIKELEIELIERPTKKLVTQVNTADNTRPVIVEALNTDIDESSNFQSSYQQSLAGSSVTDEVIIVDGDNASEARKSRGLYSESNYNSGDDSDDDDELFPKTINPKLTAVPMKIVAKENIRDTNSNTSKSYKDDVDEPSPGNGHIIENLQSDALGDDLNSTSLISLM